jgi:hypothetical protein
MVIWQGWGILALIIPPVMAELLDLLLYKTLGMNSAPLYGKVNAASIVGVLLGACVLWFGGRWLNNQPVKRLVDPESGETVELKDRHTLFWIPMQYWAFLWLLGALASVLLD